MDSVTDLDSEPGRDLNGTRALNEESDRTTHVVKAYSVIIPTYVLILTVFSLISLNSL